MLNDPLADAMTLIKNAENAGRLDCEVRPASKLIGHVLTVMQETGYIGPYEFVEDNSGGRYRVQLKGTINNCGVIKPRHAIKKTDFEKWESRYLPAQDFGTLIVTTTAGVLSHSSAKEIGTGGKLLAYVY